GTELIFLRNAVVAGVPRPPPCAGADQLSHQPKAAAAEPSGLTFLQISDSHVGSTNRRNLPCSPDGLQEQDQSAARFIPKFFPRPAPSIILKSPDHQVISSGSVPNGCASNPSRCRDGCRDAAQLTLR